MLKYLASALSAVTLAMLGLTIGLVMAASPDPTQEDRDRIERETLKTVKPSVRIECAACGMEPVEDHALWRPYGWRN